jgi:superfamily I DNA/RNA helicase
MPKSKLQKEFLMDEDGTVVVPKELLPEPTISLTALKKTVKRPMSDAQKANCDRLIEANKKRWASVREAKEKQSVEAVSSVKLEKNELVEKGSHVRLKVKENIVKPRKAKEPKKSLPIVSETEEETTEVDTEDEVPEPRHVSRQARRQIRTLKKIDEVIEQASNPYMDRLMGRWK